LQELGTIFPEIDIPSPKLFLRTKWWQDEFSFGAYVAPLVGFNPLSFEIMAKSVEDKLFFAGDGTTSARFGTADGSYTTGVRAARRILELKEQMEKHDHTFQIPDDVLDMDEIRRAFAELELNVGGRKIPDKIIKP